MKDVDAKIAETRAKLEAIDTLRRYADAVSIEKLSNADIDQAMALFNRQKAKHADTLAASQLKSDDKSSVSSATK